MADKNVRIVQECIEQIINRKRFDRIYDYYSDRCVLYHAPYVGVGLLPDSGGQELVIKGVAANGPAAGKVQAGDVLLRAVDANGAWEGRDQLDVGLWGQGELGTEVTLTLLRNGESFDVTLTRGRVEGFGSTVAEIHDSWRRFLLEEMPDFHAEIIQILGSGDRVAFFLTNTGTSTIYHRSAVWAECNIVRLENDRIVEWWGAEDQYSYLRQLGFRVLEPVR